MPNQKTSAVNKRNRNSEGYAIGVTIFKTTAMAENSSKTISDFNKLQVRSISNNPASFQRLSKAASRATQALNILRKHCIKVGKKNRLIQNKGGSQNF